MQRDDGSPGGRRADPADHGRQRYRVAANAQVERQAVWTLLVGPFDPQRDHGHVRGREREHRAEGVEVAEQFRFARQDQQRGESREEEDREPRRAKRRMQAREQRR